MEHTWNTASDKEGRLHSAHALTTFVLECTYYILLWYVMQGVWSFTTPVGYGGTDSSSSSLRTMDLLVLSWKIPNGLPRNLGLLCTVLFVCSLPSIVPHEHTKTVMRSSIELLVCFQ